MAQEERVKNKKCMSHLKDHYGARDLLFVGRSEQIWEASHALILSGSYTMLYTKNIQEEYAGERYEDVCFSMAVISLGNLFLFLFITI